MMPEPLPPEIQSLALAAIAKQIKAVDPAVRAAFADDYEPGETRTFRSPLDGKRLGKIRRNDPDPSWQIVNRRALREWLREQGREVTSVSVAEADWAEALAVLEQHAPHLITETTDVPDAELDGALADSAEQGEAIGPGIEYVHPVGSLVVTVDPDTGAAAAAALARSGQLDWSRRPEIAPNTRRRTAS